MRFSIAVILAIVFPLLAAAEVSTIKIPGQDWTISFDSPPLSGNKMTGDERNSRFGANSGRFNISLFVESPRGEDTHRACYEFYWPKASRNPAIDKNTIVVNPGNKYIRVQYDIVMELEGQVFRQKNVNYFIGFGGKWIDVHISIINPTGADEQTFAIFDKSLRYGH